VVGTGKRVGKTAVTGHVARLLSRDRRVVVVAMGRGGPAEPEVVRLPPTVETLLELSRAGRHAASDHLETAAVAGVETVGCRRCGGGLAGGVFVSNVAEGAEVARTLEPDVVVFDGSGAALPPVRAGGTIVVVGGNQDPGLVSGYLNAYRLLLADLVVVTMAEAGTDWEAVRDAVRTVVPSHVGVVATVLRPRPMSPIGGRRVAYFSTAPPRAHDHLAGYLSEEHGADVVYVSGSLADRSALRDELEAVDADLYLVELKAAAVDVVAEDGARRGIEIVLAANDVVPLPGQLDLDESVLHMAGIAR
jgi:cyclic 2,3-diphosphoglycerate synthetase